MILHADENLTLRAWEFADLDAFYDIYSRDDVMQWLGTRPRRAVASMQEAEEKLRGFMARSDSMAPPCGLWAVLPQGQESPVGTVLMCPLQDRGIDSGEVEIGWHLHPDWQGRGLATGAATALLNHARSDGMTSVLAVTDLDNVKSQAVASRLGMFDEGITDRWFGLTLRQFRWTSS